MSSGNRAISVDDIAGDEKELIKMVRRLAPMAETDAISLDSTWQEGKNFQAAKPSSCAVLIQKKSANGAVRVYSDPVTNVVTGPHQDEGVVLIVLQANEGCRLLGSPSVKWFTCSKNVSN